MNGQTIIGLVIYSAVSLLMMSIGILQYQKKDEPVGFYSLGKTIKKEEISDLVSWNKKHGIMFILFGISVEISFLLSITISSILLQMLLLIGPVIIALPCMMIYHHILEKKYLNQQK